MFGPEDEEDFTPAANSKLASLFGQPMDLGNTSLTYTAPKQPKRTSVEPMAQSTQPESSSKLSLIIVEAVQVYKLEDGNYNNLGRLGAALLGSNASKAYQLLVYKNKQNHLTAPKITDKFQFTVQEKNFASFYDERGQNWSIMFDSESGAVSFARHIGLARACAVSDKVQPFYVQDLKVGEGPPAEMGDLLEIRYTTSPLIDSKLEMALETNIDAEKPQRVKIRKGVWEEALVGASKGCKRLIVLAPILFGPWKPLADPNHRIVVEVEVGRIKACRRSRENTSIDILHRSESPESNVDSSTDETSIKARGASISEALTNSPKSNKASIISRMARMGQATLPLKGAVVCNPSDSEETEEESVSASTKVSPKLKSFSSKRSTSRAAASLPGTKEETSSAVAAKAISGGATLSSQDVSIFQHTPVSWHQTPIPHPQAHPQQYFINGVPFSAHPDVPLYAASHQVVPVPTVLSSPSGAPAAESMSVFLSENRIHHSEVRMGLSKISDKVSQALEKLEALQQPPVLGAMEPRALLAKIQKLVVENEQLKIELADKRLKLEQQNEKVYQLLQQKIFEQNATSSSWEQRQDPALQSVIIGLQQEKAKLASELSETAAKTTAVQMQAASFERITIELQEEVSKLTSRLQDAYFEIERGKQTIKEQENFIINLKEKTDLSKDLHGTQDNIIGDLKANVQDLQASNTQLQAQLLESKKQQEYAALKFSEELTLMKGLHKEELEKVKEKFEEQQKSLMEKATSDERDNNHKESTEHLKENIERYKSEIASLKEQLLVAHTSSIVDLKKVMNVMFKHLKSQFAPEKNYDGSTIREIILSAIQSITLEFVSMKTGSKPIRSKPEKKEELNGKSPSDVNASSVSNKSLDNKEAIKENDGADCAAHPLVSEQKSDDGQVKEGIEVKEALRDIEEARESEENLSKTTPDDSKIEEVEKLDTKEKSSATTSNVVEASKSEEESSGTAKRGEKSREPSTERIWKPQPPPPPLFDDEEDDDDWLS